MSYDYPISSDAGGASGTAKGIIWRALKMLGILAAGEAPTSEDQADGVVELNQLLSTWANERLLIHGVRRSTHTLTASLSPHTIGTAGTFAVTRPVRIERAGIIRAGETAEHPLKLLTDAEYAAISDKALTEEVPQRLWVEWTHPTANLWLWPVPTTAATLVLYTWSRISSFAAADAVDLPPGYENALAHALALQWAPMFGVEPSGTLRENATTALAAIKRTNAPEVLMEMDPGVRSGRGGTFDWRTGE